MHARPAALLLVAAALAAGCGGPSSPAGVAADAPRSARGVALALFHCAHAPQAETIALLFGTDLGRETRTRLDLALAPLAQAREVRVVSEGPAGRERIAVDLVASLATGGTARYMVQAERAADGNWRIVSFQGPGLSWPVASSPKDEGLTTSAPPAGAPRAEH